MKKIIVLFLSGIVIFGSCKKPEAGTPDDLAGDGELKGTAWINDTLNYTYKETLLTNQAIELKNPADSATEKFITSQKTDAYGGFHFLNIDKKADYFLHASKITDSLTYSVLQKVNLSTSAKEIKLVLYPDTTKYNIVNVIARDKLTGGLLSNAKICLFTSKQVSDSNACEGSFASGFTNSFGRFTITRVPVGTIYINALDSVGKVKIKASDNVVTRITGLYQKEMFLQ